MSGFTQIENEILEQVAKTKLNGTQYRILLAVWRNTYGWQQKEKDMSLSFIANATDIHKKQIEREINALIKMNVITVVKEASFSKSRVIAFNENFSNWVTEDRKQDSRQVTKTQTPNEKEESTVSELVPSTVSGLAPQEIKVKEISKEKDDRGIEHNLSYVSTYEKYFGPFPLGIFKQQMDDWLDNSRFKEPEAIICEVIERVKLESPKSPPKYIQQTLVNLHNGGYFTLAAVKEYNAKFDAKKKNKGSQVIPLTRPAHWKEPEALTAEERAELEADLQKEDIFPF